MNEPNKRFRKTKKGVVCIIYSGQRASSRTRKQHPPEYTLEELRNWCLSQPHFHRLYEEWVVSGYKRNKKPSIDRINPNKGYSFDNIQLMTFYENNYKQGKYERTHFHQYIKIVQKTLTGKIVRIWEGINPTAKQLGISRYSLRDALDGRSKTCLGYKWSRLRGEE